MNKEIEVPLDNATFFQTTRKLSRKAKKSIVTGSRKRVRTPRKKSAIQKLRRKEQKKAKAKAEREAREIMMIEYLVKNGWGRSGRVGEVWTIGAWKDGFDDFKTTLHRAYRTQLKLESQGFERPIGMDDDLMENL